METFDLPGEQVSSLIIKHSLDTSPCPQCGRNFLSERLSKHLDACKKISSKKRKPFDSRIQRQATIESDNNGNLDNFSNISSLRVPSSSYKSSVNRTVSANIITTTTKGTSMVVNRKNGMNTTKIVSSKQGTNGKSSGEDKSHMSKSNWREQHEQFIRTVRAARGVKVDELPDSADSYEKKLPSGYIQCPTCDRSFNRKAAERHIEWCGEKKSFTSNHRSSPQSLDAMAKFKARSTYKPPIESRIRNGRKNIKASTNTSPSNVREEGEAPRVRSVSTSNLKEARSTDTINLTCSTLRRSNDQLTPKTRGRSVDRGTTGANNKSTSSKQAAPRAKAGGYFSGLSSIIPNTGSRVKAFLASSSNKNQVKAPIVKFKDKFPLAAKSDTITSAYMATSDTLQELLKRPIDNEAYSKQPKTVPGVRTGGMSPIRSTPVTNSTPHDHISTFDSLSLMKRSLDDLMLYNSQQIGVARNSIPNIKTTFSLNKSTIALLTEKSAATMASGEEPRVSSNMLTSVEVADGDRRAGEAGGGGGSGGGGSSSIDSGLRGSTSGSSGEEQSIDGRKASLTASEESVVASRLGSSESNLPRWCHQCGTKYPMQGAKYCYECGARRLGTLASIV